VCAGDLVCCGQHGDNPVRIFAAPRRNILWRHAAMVEVGLSETGGGITGRSRRSCLARRTGPDVSASSDLGCASAGRAAMLGVFPGYSDARRGASPLRLPACRAGQQCVSPPNCRPGPRSSRSGQCFPEAEQGGQGPPLVLSCCCFLSWRLLRHRFENRDGRAGQPPAPRRRRPCPHDCKAGACRGGRRAGPGQVCCSVAG